jgi:predicted O-methyltransferase YrrM
MVRRILAAGLVVWIVLAGAFVAWTRPSSSVAAMVFLQGFVLLGIAYAVIGIRSANTRIARLYSATTASERNAAAWSSLQAEIGEVAAHNRIDLRTDVRVGGDRVISELGKAIEMGNRGLLRQVEALTNLNAMMPLDRPMPAARGHPASPDLLLLLVDVVRQTRPGLIVDCGSGTSTLWFARALRHFGIDGRVVALEHDKQYASEARQYVEDHDLAELIDVREAPLETFLLDGTEWAWYAAAAWKDLDEIDLLLVNGPPANIIEKTRFPALPLLADRLSRRALIVVGDLAREGEREIVADWLAACPEFSAEQVRLEGGGAVLRRASGVANGG